MAISDVASKTSVCGRMSRSRQPRAGARDDATVRVGRPGSTGFRRIVVGHQQVTSHTNNLLNALASRATPILRNGAELESRHHALGRKELDDVGLFGGHYEFVGSTPSTKLTRQSAQSGVPRRTQSLQLIESSISLLMAAPSLSTTLHRGCDTSGVEIRRDLRGHLRGAKEHASLNTRRANGSTKT